MSFDDLNINENILRGIYSHGFEKPSSIQESAIPKMITGKDLIAQAQSGTGKTGAFSIGNLCLVDESVQTIQRLIIVHKRELADQVTKVIKDLSSYTKPNNWTDMGCTNVNVCSE